jgi:hypothetical protein
MGPLTPIIGLRLLALAAGLRHNAEIGQPGLCFSEVLRDTIQPFPTFSEIYVEALKALDEGRKHDHRDKRLADAAPP